MANTFFKFKQFTVHQHGAAMKVTTDACLFGAWVAHQMQQEHATINNTLDIGAGTGLLSLMIAQKMDTEIDAVEINENAAEQAFQNFSASPWHQRLRLIKGDIRNLALSQTYDCVISNPPFYENELTSPDQARNTAHHSTSLSLPTLLQIIYRNLKEEGSFFLLLPFKRQKEFEIFLKDAQLYAHQIVQVHPTHLHAPFRLLIKGGVSQKTLQQSTLYIQLQNGQYTPAFTELLKEYYLYL